MGDSGADGSNLRLQARVDALESQVVELQARVAELEAVVRLGGDEVGDARETSDEGPEPTPPWGTPNVEGDEGVVGARGGGFVEYWTRPASSADEVAEVCRGIVSSSWLARSWPVRLSGFDWWVLDVVNGGDGHRALLLSDQVVARNRYHGADATITWERCDLRRWLNDEFCSSLGEALTSQVVVSRLRNEPNPTWGTPGGNDTTDQVFLLSLDEAVRHLAGDNDVDRKPQEERWLRLGKRGVTSDEDGRSAWWWLRSPGDDTGNVATVGVGGYLNDSGRPATKTSGGVRPAFWLSLGP